ncbi:MAG: hypothetical protein ABW252_24060 [Polyangiales bacterium]
MKIAAIATGLAVGALCVVSSARAVPIYQNLAGITQARAGADEQYIKRGAAGVSNVHATDPKDVVITPPRTRIDEGTPNVTVRVSLNKSAVTANPFSCSVEVRNQNGGVIIAKNTGSVPAGNSGDFNRTAVFTPAEVGAAYGAIVVLCTLPGNNVVTLKEVRVL